MKTIIVNDERLDNLVLQGGFEIPSFSYGTETTRSISSDRSYKTRRELKEIEFELPLIYKNHYAETKSFDLIERLTHFFNYDHEVKLQFSDEDWYWMAFFDGPFHIATNTRGFVEFSVVVRLLDPKKHGRTESSTSNVVVNEGTAETYPIIKATLTEDSTNVRFANNSNLRLDGIAKSINLGYPQSPAQDEIEVEELIFHDTMNSTSSWQTATEIDNGYITGEMSTNEHGFYAEKYDSPVDYKKWQGPSLIKAIGQPLQDFFADFYIRLFNVGYETGMIEIYLRDANGNRVAKIGFENAYKNKAENQGKVRIGSGSNYRDIYTKADKAEGWNNFDGVLRIMREDDVFRPYFAQIRADGRHSWVRGNLKYVDLQETAIAPITHVQVAIRIYPGTERADMAIKEIKIYRINSVHNHEEEVPVSFKAGDELEVDCSKSKVYLNGEERMDLLSLDSEFFSLVPGINQIESSTSHTVEWQEKFL